MSSNQRTVLWIGLILIALNIALSWTVIAGILFKKSGAAPASSSGGSATFIPVSNGVASGTGHPATTGTVTS